MYNKKSNLILPPDNKYIIVKYLCAIEVLCQENAKILYSFSFDQIILDIIISKMGKYIIIKLRDIIIIVDPYIGKIKWHLSNVDIKYIDIIDNDKYVYINTNIYVGMFHISTGQSLWIYKLYGNNIIDNKLNIINCIDEKYVVLRYLNIIEAISLKNAKIVYSFSFNKAILDIITSDVGKYIILRFRDYIRIIESNTGEAKYDISTTNRDIRDIYLINNDKYMLVNNNNNIKKIDIMNRNLIWKHKLGVNIIKNKYNLIISPNEKYIILYYLNDIEVINVENGNVLYAFTFLQFITDILISNTNKYIVLRFSNFSLVIDAETGKTIYDLNGKCKYLNMFDDDKKILYIHNNYILSVYMPSNYQSWKHQMNPLYIQ